MIVWMNAGGCVDFSIHSFSSGFHILDVVGGVKCHVFDGCNKRHATCNMHHMFFRIIDSESCLRVQSLLRNLMGYHDPRNNLLSKSVAAYCTTQSVLD